MVERDPEPIKVEKHIYITRAESGYIDMGRGATIYLLLPARIRHLLEDDFDYDFERRPKQITPECKLIQEKNSPETIKLVYTLRREPDSSSVQETGEGEQLAIRKPDNIKVSDIMKNRWPNSRSQKNGGV